MIRKIKNIAIQAGLLMTLAPFLKAAAGNGEEEVELGSGLDTPVESVEGVLVLLQDIVGWMQVFFYVIATLMIVLGAWDYLLSDASEEKVKKAKDKILYAIVAIIIAVIAGGIVRLVETFVNSPE
tara:strand:- start:755 stop:1129 length:375 start_codon:yes stop_codon:yes gene_type:complete